MGGGDWTTKAFTSKYASRGVTLDSSGNIDSNYRVQDLYKSNGLNKILNPKGVMRECCDTDEHPNTIPVILALDVTGSMGHSAEVCAQKLNEIMTKIYDQVKDVEFLIMGIGDMACDRVPVQASQFESDIRISDQLEKVYFEFGGGGNEYESYSAAWYFGAYHTKLDCWKRGKKGIIITLGDEPLNPYLPKYRMESVFGDNCEADVGTSEIYKDASKKYDIYHIAVTDTYTCQRHFERIKTSFGTYLGKNLRFSDCDNLADVIVDIVTNGAGECSDGGNFASSTEEGIGWNI